MRRILGAAFVLIGVAPLYAQTGNLLANPEFDTDVGGWTLTIGDAALWSAEDAHSCPGSGSVAGISGPATLGDGSPQAFQLSQCVPAGSLTSVSGMAWFRDGGQLNAIAVYFHQNADCSDFQMNPAGASQLTVASPGVWTKLEMAPVPVTGGTQALLLVLAGSHISGTPFDIDYDRAYFGEQPLIFADDFEANIAFSSTPCRWSDFAN